MYLDADRDDDGPGDYDAPDDFGGWRDDNDYWRRRFLILGGGIIALGVCAWLLPGVHSAATSSSPAARASMAALARGKSLPPAAYGSAWPGDARASQAAPHATPPFPSAAPGQRAGLAGQPSASPASRLPQCSPASIVVSLFTSQSRYGQREQPEFDVYAVSTSARACTLSYGPGAVHVAVTSHGRVVWDSAACKQPAARPVTFTLGVPQALTITWNRQASNPPGCAGTGSAGTWGTFGAVAVTHGRSSPVRSFEIGKLPAEGGLQRVADVFHLGDLHRRPRA